MAVPVEEKISLTDLMFGDTVPSQLCPQNTLNTKSLM